MAFLLLRMRGSDQVVELDELTTLGRHPSSDLQLLDRALSKQHCSIERHRQGHLLCDLHSLNGTHLNGALIRKDTWLGHGDLITLGGCQLRFVDLPASALSSKVLTNLGQDLETIRLPDMLAGTPADFGDDSDIAQENERLRRFHIACRWLVRGGERGPMLDAFLQGVELVIGASAATLLLGTSPSSLEAVASRGSAQPRGAATPMEQHALATRSGVMRVSPTGFGRKTRMVAPIQTRQAVLGLLWLEAPRALGMLEDDLLCTLCDLLAVVLDGIAKY